MGKYLAAYGEFLMAVDTPVITCEAHKVELVRRRKIQDAYSSTIELRLM